MNKTLLLIICDFLLLNLLALTRWEKAQPLTPPPPAAGRQQPADDPATARARDLADMMRLSLEDERKTREAIDDQLHQTRTALARNEQSLINLRDERNSLESSLTETRTALDAEHERLNLTAAEAEAARQRIAALQEDLRHREEEATRKAEQIAGLEKKNAEASSRIENLSVQVRVAEEEKKLLRESLVEVKQEVATVREEKQRIQDQAGTLAEGVGRLAETSGELTREIRANRPVNANTLFSEFLQNRVELLMNTRRDGFFGPTTASSTAQTVLVTDGRDVYAVCHISATPFSLTTPADCNLFNAVMRRGQKSFPLEGLRVLSLDPRIVAVPVDPRQVSELGAKLYPTALEPFKHPDAVLVNKDGGGYGEIQFKLDPQNPQYVRMDNRFFRRLVGEFSPSTGDLVFSKTGELLGIMVNRDYCVMIDNFLSVARLPAGGALPENSISTPLEQLSGRLMSLPLRLR